MRICPECQERPARDQRPHIKDGHCLPCHEYLTRKYRNRHRRKEPDHFLEDEWVW